MIVFRAFSGIAASFSLPSAVSLINEVFPPGKSRNAAFATMGGSQPVGFGLGLVLGGVFASTVGWQWGFHTAAITNLVMFILSAWQLPKNLQDTSQNLWHRLINDIDWTGAILASVGLALLSYVIRFVRPCFTTREVWQLISLQRHYRESFGHAKTTNICLLILSFALFLAFVVWVGRQERLGRPALIPNSLWHHKVFSCTCICVFCVWASFNIFEQYLNFFFQEVQKISPLGAAIRFIPAPISGALTNIVVGFIVHRVRGDWIVISTSVRTVVASVLMAIANPKWSYWACAFVANFFNPIGADGIFTVSNLLITSMFPPKTQGVAGGVFNTVSQTGKNVGLALSALIANQVTAQYPPVVDKHDPEALLAGYRAAFWFCAGLTGASLGLSVWGLRNIGKVGQKKD